MQNLSPLKKLNYMFSQLEENQITVVYYDKENKFFSVEKQGLNGVITVNNFIDDLETFIISVDYVDTMKIIKNTDRDIRNFFDSYSIKDIKDMLKRGFDLSYYLKDLDNNFLNMLYN